MACHDKTYDLIPNMGLFNAQLDQNICRLYVGFHLWLQRRLYQTVRMPRLIRNFAGRTQHFIGFTVPWPNMEPRQKRVLFGTV